jgi:murein tripeptide amidase MpaA
VIVRNFSKNCYACPVPDVSFDRYYRYDDLTRILFEYAKERPDCVRIQSIGTSYEGREIWLLTVTNFQTGEPETKPGFWCDGNIHASEVSASTAVLKILEKLLSTERAVLDERTFFLVPRLCPDGAELALADVPKIVRSGTRPYPFEDEDLNGIEREDLDGDGRILNMRVPDPNGAWVICEQEPRLMRRREPGEKPANAYRVLPEGRILNFDGLKIRARRQTEGLDFNRNFPSAWRQEHEQHGAGDYPTSELEIRAAVQAIFDRPNICGAITFHTYSGVLLRPPSRMADTDIPAEDLWTYQKLGAKGKAMTGYPDISNFHEFRYHPKEIITGTFDDWMYEHRGVHAWTVEIWAPPRQAGIPDYKYIDWFRDHPLEHDIQLLKWADENLEGNGYIDWYPFDHPQLGKVELGGWDAFYAFRNPPPKFLEAEVTPLADWAIWHATTGPRLTFRDLVIEPVDGAFRVRLAVQNEGWLPTCVTEQARQRKHCRGVIGEVYKDGMPHPTGNLEPDWLVSGSLRSDAGQLAGHSHIMAGGWGWSVDSTDDVAVFQWVLKPGKYRLVARHERAGQVEREIELA